MALLEPLLERVEIPLRYKIETPNKPISHVYFVESGIASITTMGPHRLPIEVAVVGFEGFTGVSVVLGGDRSPLDVYVQVAGEAHRIETSKLQPLIAKHPAIAGTFNRYSQVFLTQIAQTALANGRAKLEERLARWLLMGQDRMQSDELKLTHEFLALMLAVRRPGVTNALASLKLQGHVKVRRGCIVILNRDGLLDVAGKFYGVPEAELARLLG
ncbi:MAG: Crp/Fnr family transcriptional regulator [Hyphomicrobiaceae bacterium]